MVSVDIALAPSDEHLMEGGGSKVESVAEEDCDLPSKVETVVDDECDSPVRMEESRDAAPATTQETEASPLGSPNSESSDAHVASNSNRTGSWFQRDSVEATPKPSWFRRQPRSEQRAVNLAAVQDLDERARRNEAKGSSQQNSPWWRRGGRVAQPINEEQHPNDIHRYRCKSSSTPQPAAPQGETSLVVRSEPVNVLWDVMSRALRQNPLWKAATQVHESSKAAAEHRAKQGAAMRHGLGRLFRRRKVDEEETSEAKKEVPASARVPWWRRFRRNRFNTEQPQIIGETSTAIVPYQAEPHPFAAAMRKAATGVAGTCMVIVGVPLLLFPVPGPGVAMIASGVYVVSTEFEFARSWLETVKTKFGTVFDRLGIEIATPEALPAPRTSSTVLLLPSSLPPADVEEEIKDSNEDEGQEICDHTKEESSNRNEERLPLPKADGDEYDEYRKTEEVIIRV